MNLIETKKVLHQKVGTSPLYIAMHQPTLLNLKRKTFYQHLQTVIQKLPKRNIQVVMGDMNAKIGKDNDNWKGTMGKEGLGKMNENGLLFADFCTLNELIIGGTLFPHKPTHKATWISPDLQTEDQIDHITITKKWRRVLLDVRVKRGADINSDHHLLVGEFRMKLAAKKKTDNKVQRRFEIENFKILKYDRNWDHTHGREKKH